ncbi:MAG TPA: UDP-N-acetylmuramate dehydrogenase [bacterium]|nr:UDP-N-acetylmuramate dehydrogenase [bacterium]
MAKAVSDTLASHLERLCPGGVRVDEPLSRHVTFRIGGPADILLLPGSLDQLAASVAWLYREGLPFVILGRGSNVLVADRGVRGVVIKTGRGQEAVRYEDARVAAECGVSLPLLSRAASARGLSGLEFAAGIPGSIGGGVVMNAGAHDRCIADVTTRVRVLTPAGERRWTREEMGFRYRHSRLQEDPGIVLEVELTLLPADPAECLARLDAWLETRSDTQPLGPPSSGCVFRNPEGDHAGRLIDAAGAKGLRVGGAVVSDRHANYILNAGGARAAEVLTLIEQVRSRVRERSGVDLRPEIKLVGEFDPA